MLIPAGPCRSTKYACRNKATDSEKISTSATTTNKTINITNPKDKLLKSQDMRNNICIQGIKIVFMATIYARFSQILPASAPVGECPGQTIAGYKNRRQPRGLCRLALDTPQSRLP